jgi:hypothetical protein
MTLDISKPSSVANANPSHHAAMFMNSILRKPGFEMDNCKNSIFSYRP